MNKMRVTWYALRGEAHFAVHGEKLDGGPNVAINGNNNVASKLAPNTQSRLLLALDGLTKLARWSA